MDALRKGAGSSPWHDGEIAVQRRIGVVEAMDAVGRRNIRDHLIDQHREFFSQLPFVVAGTVDPEGRAWATLIAGEPGFLTSPEPAALQVDAPRDAHDPADAGLEDGDAVGMLGIELQSRRRNRLNGLVRRRDDGCFGVSVEQSFGNCPQYISLRDFSFAREPGDRHDTSPQKLERLDGRAVALIEGADALFIASYVDRDDGRRQVDVNHRGGKPGFVRLDVDGSLTIPDYAGNHFFNTLGNLVINPRAGLLFIDFETGDTLQLTGDGVVDFDSSEIAAFQGAERLLRFYPRDIVLRTDALAIRWTSRPDGASPNTLMTGSWEQAKARLAAAGLAKTWRKFRVSRIVEESSVIRSIYLEPIDGRGLPAHQAGQHLTVRLALDGEPATRSYSLSSAPTDDAYRISVKREGAASRRIHGLQVGDTIEARGPSGGFTLDPREKRPVVMLGAGVGVTPLIAMLRHIVLEGSRTRRARPSYVFYAARSKAERAFDDEMRALAERAHGAVRLFRILSNPQGAIEGDDFDVAGRIDVGLLRTRLPFDGYDFYLCGPAAFMRSLYDDLRELGVPDERIRAETFGPAALMRAPQFDGPEREKTAIATGPVEVSFSSSSKEARWSPNAGSLLELAEAHGLDPPFSCRVGECGTCKARVTGGSLAYLRSPSAAIGDGEALICCAVPAEGADRLEVDI